MKDHHIGKKRPGGPKRKPKHGKYNQYRKPHRVLEPHVRPQMRIGNTPFPEKGKMVEGELRIGGNGNGYIREVVADRGSEIEVPNEFLNTALHGDEVEVRVLSRVANGKPQGEVARIIHREKTQFVGVLEREGGAYILVPDDFRMYRNIRIKDIKGKPPTGMKILVRMTGWPEEHNMPMGEIVKVIGKPGDHDTEVNAIALDRGFDGTFPKDVEDEARKIHALSGRDFADRRDFRQTLTFTIDPKDAKDFDDAISFKRLSNGSIEIGIHIADVTHYVKEGSALEREAAQRATSVYLVDRTIPMLPERLSNELCSLVPNEDRLTFSAVFEIAANGYVRGEWFGKSIIHSTKRFTYEEAQELIERPTGDFGEVLTTLNTMARTMREQRIEAGGVEFVSNEVKCELGANGKVIRIYRKEMKDANKLIEEFMLLANRKVTEWIDRKIPEDVRVFVYRVHDEPNADKIADLQTFLKGIGHELKFRGSGVHGQDINAMLRKVEKLGEKSYVHIATVRAMAKAIYSTKNIGHFGLGFEHYTHFTSPIRRYPDMMVHRLLHRYLTGKPVAPKEIDKIERLSRYASEMEIGAADAERTSIRQKQVEYWADKLGTIWEGSISGVAPWGIFVEDKETGTEGMIHVNDLEDDFYTHEETKHRMVGQKTKKIYRLGDGIRAKVRSADLKKRLLGLSLVREK